MTALEVALYFEGKDFFSLHDVMRLGVNRSAASRIIHHLSELSDNYKTESRFIPKKSGRSIREIKILDIRNRQPPVDVSNQVAMAILDKGWLTSAQIADITGLDRRQVYKAVHVIKCSPKYDCDYKYTGRGSSAYIKLNGIEGYKATEPVSIAEKALKRFLYGSKAA